MTQLTIPESAYEQERQLARVRGKIAHSVWKFCQQHIGKTFHASDLHAAVEGVAPSSSDRILRDLRRKGLVNYRVLNRAESLYQITEVK